MEKLVFIFFIFFFIRSLLFIEKRLFVLAGDLIAADPMLCVLYRMLMKYSKNKKNKVKKRGTLWTLMGSTPKNYDHVCSPEYAH